MRLPALRPRVRPRSEPAEPTTPPREPPRWRRLPGSLRLPTNRDLAARARRNPTLKILSFLLALFLWYSIRVSGEAETTFSIPIRVEYLAPDLIVTNLPSQPAEVVLEGPSRIIDTLGGGRRFALDLSASSPGKSRIDLSADLIKPKLPDVIRVRKIDPAQVTVRIERLTRKTLPVRTELEGLPQVGYSVAEVRVAPNEVEAVGPVSRLRDLNEVKTEPVRLRRASSRIDRSVLLAWAGDYVTLSPDHVTVTVTFQQQMVSRVFGDVPVVVRNAPAGEPVELTPKNLDLTLRGPQPTLMGFALPDGSVFVDAAGLEAGTHRVMPEVELPEGVEVTRREPEFHSLRIGEPAKAGRPTAKKPRP